MLINKEEKDYLSGKIDSDPFLKNLSVVEINHALEMCFNLFPKDLFILEAGFAAITFRDKNNKKKINQVDIISELLPALIFAKRYFGKELPNKLKEKFLNLKQAADTAFELKCMGIFQERHHVIYEPNLSDGKIPDFKISLKNSLELYAECKTQKTSEAEFHRVFEKFTDKIFQTLNSSKLLESAWEKGLRTEIIPSKTPNQKQIYELAEKLKSFKPENFYTKKQVTNTFSVICIPREKSLNIDSLMHRGLITVGQKPTGLGYENAHVLVHSWYSLDSKRRRSQRKLLSSARKKLEAIPKGTLGMICIDTSASKNFLPDVQELMVQKQYSYIPIVWLNPFQEGKVIARNEYLYIRDELFRNTLIRNE